MGRRGASGWPRQSGLRITLIDRPAGCAPTATFPPEPLAGIENHAQPPRGAGGARRRQSGSDQRASATDRPAAALRGGARRTRRRPGRGRPRPGGRDRRAGPSARCSARRCSPCWSAPLLALLAGRSIAAPLTAHHRGGARHRRGRTAALPPLRHPRHRRAGPGAPARCTRSSPSASTSCAASRPRAPRWWRRWSRG